MSRLSVLLVLLASFVTCACASPTPTPDPGLDDALVEKAESIREALDGMSPELSSTDSEDLKMAWTDLEADLRSIVDDFELRPDTVEWDGVIQRLEGFEERFVASASMRSVEDHWARLLDEVTAVRREVAR